MYECALWCNEQRRYHLCDHLLVAVQQAGRVTFLLSSCEAMRLVFSWLSEVLYLPDCVLETASSCDLGVHCHCSCGGGLVAVDIEDVF